MGRIVPEAGHSISKDSVSVRVVTSNRHAGGIPSKRLVAILVVVCGLIGGCRCQPGEDLWGTALVDPVRRSSIPAARPEGAAVTVVGTPRPTTLAER
jgi:hypothetical protein